MGNLLLTVLLNLETAGYKVSGYGVDIDETLLAVSSVNNAWSQANIQLFHQDGLQDLLLDPVDLALSDLPIGYYQMMSEQRDLLLLRRKAIVMRIIY